MVPRPDQMKMSIWVTERKKAVLLALSLANNKFRKHQVPIKYFQAIRTPIEAWVIAELIKVWWKHKSQRATSRWRVSLSGEKGSWRRQNLQQSPALSWLVKGTALTTSSSNSNRSSSRSRGRHSYPKSRISKVAKRKSREWSHKISKILRVWWMTSKAFQNLCQPLIPNIRITTLTSK